MLDFNHSINRPASIRLLETPSWITGKNQVGACPRTFESSTIVELRYMTILDFRLQEVPLAPVGVKQTVELPGDCALCQIDVETQRILSTDPIAETLQSFSSPLSC